MLISEEYRELNRSLHGRESYGGNGDKWAPRVRALIEQYRARTILDYGCGKGALARELGPQVAEYDPAIPGKDGAPAPADLVVCTDVMEHIEPECLDEVLDHLESLTKVCLFAVVSTRPAQKFLEDGRNAHLIVQPWEFWEAKFGSRFRFREVIVNRDIDEIELVLTPRRPWLVEAWNSLARAARRRWTPAASNQVRLTH